MKASELRLGNWYWYHIHEEKDPNGNWVPVPARIDIGDLIWLDANPDDPNYQPMPLTEATLEGFGFHKCLLSIPTKYRKPQCRFDIYERGGKFLAGFKHGTVILEYAHQLQNLHFALEKTEL
jgi:hypothetical protein